MSIVWIGGGWVLLNALAALVTSAWHRAWCRTVSWTASGILPSAEPLEAGAGETAVLFVHGFNDVPYVWRRFVDALAEKGCHCRAMRLPGAGAADCRPTLEAWRQAVDDELKALRKTHRRVVLVGHSLGGALSLDAVLRAEGVAGGTLPDKLLLLAPLIEVSRARSPVLSPLAWYRILRILLPALRWVPSVFKEWLQAEDDPAFSYRRDRFNEIGWYRALFALVADLRRAAGRRLPVQTVVYVAGGDRVVDSAATRRWFADETNSTLVEWSGASHVIPLNERWREIAATMTRPAD